MTAESARPGGMLRSLRAVLSQALALFITRGELAALELAEARDRALRWLVLGLIAAVLLLAALMTLSLWVAAIFWDGPRAVALGVLALAYAAIGVFVIGIVRRESAAAPPVLEQTFTELQKDRAALISRSHGTDDATG